MKKYELLAPAGNFEALRAAVQNGADAVYLAGKEFGARKFANNLTDDELREAVDYCHIRGISLYVTVNTLIFNLEWEKLRHYLDFLYIIGVDAVIVQDIGVLDYLRKNYPDWHIHCSTQMSVETVADIRYLESLGVSRVILGREMSVDDIERAKKVTNVELEIFIHGALCISVSGQCLLSSMIGGRSGNRGSCAQPCRQKYVLYNLDKNEPYKSGTGDYLLSPRDLCTIDQIKTITEAGVYSLKIEGRMKSAEYVAVTVAAYKTRLEAEYGGVRADTEALQKTLAVFNRGFTDGHLFGASGKKLMSMDSPGNQGYYLGKVVRYDKRTKKLSVALADDFSHLDEIQIRRKDEIIGGRAEKLEYRGSVVKKCFAGQTCEVNFKHICQPGEPVYKTYDEELMNRARSTYNKEKLAIPVGITAVIKKNNTIYCSMTDGWHTVDAESSSYPQVAENRAISVVDVKNQLSKLGGTPYEAEYVDVTLDDGLTVPVRELNSMRRMLTEKLNQQRSRKYIRSTRLAAIAAVEKWSRGPKAMELTCSVSNLQQFRAVLHAGAQIIYYRDLQTLGAAVSMTKIAGCKSRIIPEIYRLTTDSELLQAQKIVSDLGLDTVLVQSYGHLSAFRELKRIADYNMNIVNDFSYRFYREQGLERITLSLELNMSQISSLQFSPEYTEIIGYGFFPVMAMKHCVIPTVLNRQTDCGLCLQDGFAVVDKLNESFRIVRRGACITEIYNSKKLLMLEYMDTFAKKGIGYYRLNFLNESPAEIEKLWRLHSRRLNSSWSNEDQQALEAIKATGITYGHLNRGVV